MAGGALSEIQKLLDSTSGLQRQAYDEGRAANTEAQGALAKPRTDRSGLAFAAAMLSGGQGGNFGAELGQGLRAYNKEAGYYEDSELDRATKLAALKAANARLLGQHAGDMFDIGLKRFSAPGTALQYQDDLDELNGDDGIPVMPGPGASLPPDTRPPASPPGQNPNSTVGALGSDVLTGGAGQDPMVSGRPPAAPPEQDPLQVAQAMPGQPGQPAQDPQAARQKQLYDWALQVQEAAARDPGRWSRRSKNKAALAQAEKIIDNYRAMSSGSNDPVMLELKKMRELEELRKLRRENDPAQAKPTEKMRGDLAAARRAAGTLDAEFTNYEKLVEKYGAEALPTEGKAELGTAYMNLLMRLKNVYELGAITGPDEKILNTMLMNPQVDGVWDVHKAWNPEGRVKAQTKLLKDMVKRDLDAAEKNLLGDRQPVTDSVTRAPLSPDDAAELEALLAEKRRRQGGR